MWAHGQRYTQFVCMFCAVLITPDSIDAESPDLDANKILAT